MEPSRSYFAKRRSTDKLCVYCSTVVSVALVKRPPHSFAIDPDRLPQGVEVTHVNLNDQTVEGLRHKKWKAFSVQYHPEASPGPHDSDYLFGHRVTTLNPPVTE